MVRINRVVLLTMVTATWATPAAGQLGALVSPGRLSRAHAALEGVRNCLSCHSAGQQVSAQKCLTCHRPVADRIARKVGVHKRVTTDCVSCHVEHAGVDAELRPFDQRRFDHTADTTFPLDGEHAPLRSTCASCHKTRSFLTLKSTCSSCHTDSHKGALGTECSTCHSSAVRFAETRARFDHSRTAFPLTGGHVPVACTACHVNKTYAGVRFASCANCHSDVHRERLGPSCSSCHTTAAWRTTRIDHGRTVFPLRGLHAAVACAKCHVNPAMKAKPAAGSCATCHADPHRGVFKQDCAACHSEAGFKKGSFDHATTKFALVDKHAGLTCASCHKGVQGSTARQLGARTTTLVDYRGLTTACQSCHADVHRGELGPTCEACHSARTFAVTAFAHRNDRPFFDGGHESLSCNTCHVATLAPARATTGQRPERRGFTLTPVACVSCHRDVHLGQVGSACESCHDVAKPRFALARFAHSTTRFPLTGRHDQIECARCHTVEVRDYPGGHGVARRLAGLGTACGTCHTDVHRGELPQACEQCHTTERFTLGSYTHRNARVTKAFFSGKHATARCEACHKPAGRAAGATRALPSFKTSTTCVNCHTDIHRGALGPRCETCHRW